MINLIINDFKKNKFITFSIILFIAVGAMLFSLSTILSVNLGGSIENLMTLAKTPDYLQMHKGDIDLKRLDDFAKSHPNVADFQVLEFINVEGAEIILNNHSQAESLQDNGITTQSKQFDYLLDIENNIIEVREGEIYLPLMFYKDGTAREGDRATIYDEEFIIKGFFRDSQMNSNMSGSKRILLNEKDIQKLRNRGEMEYLIEFMLKDYSKVSEFEKDYFDEGLESEGQMVTKTMFTMINGLSDGILIAILLLCAILLVLIAFLCIKFTIDSKILEDLREIGVLKAIGFRSMDIKRLYLLEYSVFALIGVLLGMVISFFLKDMALGDLFLYMGKSENYERAPIFAFLSMILLFLVIVLYLNGVLNKIKKILPIKAMKREGLDRKKKKSLRMKSYNTNYNLALIDLFSELRLYINPTVIIIFTMALISIPANLQSTLSNPKFINNFGFGDMDLILEIKEGSKETLIKDIEEILNNDKDIENYAIYKTISDTITLPNGEEVRMRMSIGEHLKFPINLIRGRLPENEKEITISRIYSEELPLNMGEKIKLSDGRELEVVGIYADISNGGKTAKANFPIKDKLYEKVSFPISFKNRVLAEETAHERAEAFQNMDQAIRTMMIWDYYNQSFGSVISQIALSRRIASVSGIFVLYIIIYLFARLIIVREERDIAIKKIIGYNSFELKLQYTIRFLILSLVGVFLGHLLSKGLGEIFLTVVLSSFGGGSTEIAYDILMNYIVLPLAIIATVINAQHLASNQIENMTIVERIKETA